VLGAYGINTYLMNWLMYGTTGWADPRGLCIVGSIYGANGVDGAVMEFLPKKAAYSTIASGVFAHPLRVDGFGTVQVGNLPETEHTEFYPGHAFLDVRSGGSTILPALLLRDDALCATNAYGAMEKSGGNLWWTDNSLNRSAVVVGLTNSTVPSSTTTIKAWVNVTANGQTFKLPLYQ
jgi:hypothetical protein